MGGGGSLHLWGGSLHPWGEGGVYIHRERGVCTSGSVGDVDNAPSQTLCHHLSEEFLMCGGHLFLYVLVMS